MTTLPPATHFHGVVSKVSHRVEGVLTERPALADFPSLFREHFRFVCLTLRGLGVRDNDIEDLAQEVFVVVHRKLDSEDPPQVIKAWLFGICFRTASSHRRMAWLRRHVHHESDDELPHSDPLPDDLIAMAQNRELVLAALDAIELPRRAVFMMHDLDEFPASQIAATLSVPVNTVYSRLRLAREEFRKAVHRIRASRGSR